MIEHQEAAGGPRRLTGPSDLLRDVGYEVIPLRNAEQAVLADVPTEIPLTVTVTEARGLGATLDLTERLIGHGYSVAPHLSARQFTDRGHVRDVLTRLREAEVRSVFVVGGDVPEPAGAFSDAYSLLQAMEAEGHPFEEVGIAGYPEDHAVIPRTALDLALKRKARMATRIVTQICFDAATTASWAARIAAEGVELPVYVGVPGPVSRQKLMRISAGLGLGQSARFLRKQQRLLWRLLRPAGYDPTRLARRLAAACTGAGNVQGLHVFTFNELGVAERWRRELLADVIRTDDRS